MEQLLVPWRLLRPKHLHTQTVLMTSLVLLLALGLWGGWGGYQQHRSNLAHMESESRTLAKHIALASGNLILSDRLDELENLVIAFAEHRNVRQVHVFSDAGQVLAEIHQEPGQASRAKFAPREERETMPVAGQDLSLLSPDGSRIVAWHPVQVGEKTVGWVQVNSDLAELRAQGNLIWRNSLLAAALVIGLSALLLSRLMRSTMTLFDEAGQFAANLIDGEGQTQLEVKGPLEFRKLQKALNEASVLLQQHLLVLQDSIQTQQLHEAQLAAQNAQLGAIFTLSPDGLLTFDETGRVQFANQAFLSLSRLSSEQVLGQTDAQLDALLLEQAAETEQPFPGLAACFGATKQVLSLRGDKPLVLSFSGRESDSTAVKRVLYVCDVTQAHNLDRMKSEFLSLAAHELRTPLTSIYGFVELMVGREIPEAKRQNMLTRIHRQCKLMINILNELLDLARIEARGNSDFKFGMLDLEQVVEEVLTDFKPPEGRERPRIEAANVPTQVCIDPQKMQQILLNTLSNAYKYSPDGGPVTLRFVRATKQVSSDESVQGQTFCGLEIRDQGIGLSTEHLARMGERFFRADTSGHIPGTGLNVSIVKELMELMGGRLQVESELGQGTCVTLWFKC